MDKLKSAIPESRKLRVLLLTILAYLLNTYTTSLSPEQVEQILNLVMVWLAGQSLADMGLQGKLIGEVRNSKKKGLDAGALTDAIKAKDLGAAVGQLSHAAALVEKLDDYAEEAEKKAEEAEEKPEGEKS